jgi:signal transduction histidine kinase/predicted CoA-binding protein
MAYDFLRKVPLFANLPEEDFERLCDMATEVSLPAGEMLFSEGSQGDMAYIIKKGQVEILKSSAGRTVLLALRQAGDVIGEMALLESTPRTASVRARTDSELIAIGQEQLEELVNTSPSAARSMLHTVTARWRVTEMAVGQSEKLAQLGTMTAGIAHEINNPTAAIQRGATQLHQSIAELQRAQLAFSRLQLSGDLVDRLLALDERARERASKPEDLDTLARSDRAADCEDWLDERGIPEGWELAPILVDLGYDPPQLDQLAEDFSDEQLPAVIDWLGATYDVYSLLQEITYGSGRIAEIVKALKSYVYLDQAPIQAVDVHESLDNTLVMLRGQLKSGISVRREYDEDLPKIEAYGSELNQVWTNILSNAIDALEGVDGGQIVIRTRLDGKWVVIEFEDNGPGIPADIQDKLFSPFFTTKPVGKGTGLGLSISYNIVQKHGGTIKLFSRPGRTRFRVKLPVDFEEAQAEQIPMENYPTLDDSELKKILEETRRIAVVGISAKTERVAHSVPAYLQSQGYQIIPVNPNHQEVLGEKCYPDLLSIPEPVDVVLIFRRSDAVPPIVDQAIEIGAKVVWMQEGIVNEDAAANAVDAGIKVVMNTCMRATHKRLMV